MLSFVGISLASGAVLLVVKSDVILEARLQYD